MVNKMGFTVIIEEDIKNWSITKVYKCSNCGTTIFRTPPLKSGDFFDIDWNHIPPVCPCGEKLLSLVTTYMPLINEMKSIEI